MKLNIHQPDFLRRDEEIGLSLELVAEGYQFRFHPHEHRDIWWGELCLTTSELVALKDQIEEELGKWKAPKAPPPGGIGEALDNPLLDIVTAILRDPKATIAAGGLAKNLFHRLGINLL